MKRSLPRSSKHQAERLGEITEVIRELVGDDLVMLILFGSYARGDWVDDRYVEGHITYTYESDFDLLVVVEKRSQATRHADFFTVFPRATQKQEHLFDLLKRAYIDARYKYDYKISKSELEYLAARVSKLQALTKKVCRAKIASMVPKKVF